METGNRITDVTRRNIADMMQINNISYCGNLSEPDFLSRVFNLKGMPSRDYRYSNAYDDIYQHTVNNSDYDIGWIYGDSRINLLYCPDNTYLNFLSNTIHPIVRSDSMEIANLLKLYNEYLSHDGFNIVQSNEISGKPIYSGQNIDVELSSILEKKRAIKKYLDTAYINRKIATMTDSLDKDTDIAIGTAKELLETTCKSILKHQGEDIDPQWTLTQLLKHTTNNISIEPKDVTEPDKAKKSIQQILGGISAVVQGVSELRNLYGTGHGKEANFKGLEPKYAKLVVGVVSDIVLFYLSSIGTEQLELIE
jgi:hypothetical protein